MNKLKSIFRKSVEIYQDFVRSYIVRISQQQALFVNQRKDKTLQNLKDNKTVKIRKMQYAQLDRFFIRFFNSKPIEGRVGGKSLAFIIGAQHSGKSQYIQKNIAQVKRRKNSLLGSSQQKMPQFNIMTSPQSHQVLIQQQIFSNPYYLILKQNYHFNPALNFKGFIQDLHEKILQQIQNLLVRFQEQQIRKLKRNNIKDQVDSILTSQIIKQIVIHQNASEYIYVYIKDVIFAILEDKDPIYINQQSKAILQNFNHQISGQDSHKFFTQYYQQLIHIIWKSQMPKQKNQSIQQKNQSIQQKAQLGRSKKLPNKSIVQKNKVQNTQHFQKTKIALKLFYSVFCRIQQQNRPQQYINSWYQNGLQTTNYLFSLLNFISGTGSYVQSFQKVYIASSTPLTQRQQIKKFLLSSNNYILKGNHIDTMICLINVEQLYCFKNKQWIDWFDHVVLSTVRTDSNIRKHFPLIIQIPNRKILDDTLNLGKIQGSNPVVVEIPGYLPRFFKFSNMSEILTDAVSKKMLLKLGRNPHVWKNALQHLANGNYIQDVYIGAADYQIRQKIQTQARLNRLYTYPQVLPYINNGTIDLQVWQNLRIISKCNGMIVTMNAFYSNVMFKLPIFQCMYSQNLVYHMYYLPYLDYSNVPSSLALSKQYLKHLASKSNIFTRRLWRIKTKQYRVFVRDIKYKHAIDKIMFEKKHYFKDHIDQELHTTYYGNIYDYGLLYKETAYKYEAAD